MIRFLFLDLDDTILDFHKAERLAIAKTFRSFGLEPTEEVLNRYHVINKIHWERLERGEETRLQVLENRFADLFSEMGVPADPAQIAKSYEGNLGIGHFFLPDAEETVHTLAEKYPLYLASNGTDTVQHSRLTSAGLYPYFKGIFISQEVGFNKPAKEFFDVCASKIPGFNAAQALMVGDSLTSDILGGANAGMKTCWVNPEHKPCRPDISVDFQINSITELPALLEQLNKE